MYFILPLFSGLFLFGFQHFLTNHLLPFFFFLFAHWIKMSAILISHFFQSLLCRDFLWDPCPLNAITVALGFSLSSHSTQIYLHVSELVGFFSAISLNQCFYSQEIKKIHSISIWLFSYIFWNSSFMAIFDK